jgi:hypothetical protein
MSETVASIPLSAQFAEILVSDISAFVSDLQDLNSPETSEIIASARRRMEQDNVLCMIEDSAVSLGAMVAVDGGNNVLSVGSGSQCFILAVSYSLKSGSDPIFRMRRIDFDSSEPSALMYGVRNALELALINETNESESFCIVDNSWVSLLQTINRTIVQYNDAPERDSDIIKPYLDEMLSERGTFIQALKNPRNIAMSKSGISSLYASKYTDDKLPLADKIFLLGILKAGEYTKPVSLKSGGMGQLSVHTDSIFKTKDEVKDIYNSSLSSTGKHGLCITYFRPFDWSPVKRIEFHKSLIQDGGTLFQSMLKTVAQSMMVPTIMEPLEQFLVDEIVKRHTGRLPGVYQTAGIANLKDFSSPFAMQLITKMRT